MPRPTRVAACAAGLALSLASAATAQLRVVAWNISNYAGGRDADIRNVVYGTFEGRSLRPDVIAADEIVSAGAQAAFLANLNAAPGSPGDWAAAPFVDGADTESTLFYRTSRVVLVENRTWTIAVGSSDSNNQPRNTYRYDLRLAGYGAPAATLSVYAVHMKAGSTSGDNARRLVESTRIRQNAAGVDTNGAGSAKPEGTMFLVGGDMNMQSSTQTSYVRFIGAEGDNTGRFFDPIASPGTWNNSGAFRFIHTQDPSGAGGMDDRHDQILVCAGLIDGGGFDYVGDPTIPYSTSTWNDPNHSYRAWGNDGTSFNLSLTTTGNTMVGPSIAQSIINCAPNGGHIPVLLDLRVPAKVASVIDVDFGVRSVDEPAGADLEVLNAADLALWGGGGASPLHYSLAASPGFSAPAGPFADAAGGEGTLHSLAMDTSTPGEKVGTLTITSDDPDEPVRLVTLHGRVEAGPPPCRPDFNGDGFLDFFDYDDYVLCYETGQCPDGRTADFNGDQFADFFDYDDFVIAYEAGC